MRARSMCGGAALVFVLAAGQARAESPIPAAPATQASAQVRDASLAEYRKHLLDLTTLTEACAKARDAKACDPALLGPDDRISLADNANAERRLVRYQWLRALFLKAQDKDAEPAKSAATKPKEESTEPAPPTTSELLKDAETRLAHDLAQALGAAAAGANHGPEREAMKQVLAGRDFRNLEERTARDSALEKMGDWLNRFFDSVAKLRSRSAWIGRAIVWGFILAVCVGLAWGLLQLERRWRMRLTPEDERPAPELLRPATGNCGSTRPATPQRAAQWREAMHSSTGRRSRAWNRSACGRRTGRARRASTWRWWPPEDPRRAGLATLTRSFERTWYGGRAAGESELSQGRGIGGGADRGRRAAGRRGAMKFLSSLDAKDRRLLLWCVGIASGAGGADRLSAAQRQQQRQSPALDLLVGPARRAGGL